MDEKTAARRIDPTHWAEARPPHLPDRFTEIPARVWPFLIVAAVIAFHGWYHWSRGATGSPLDLLGELGPAVAAALLGAALFLRHPDAHRTLPLLAAGVTLFAIQELMRILAPLADDALTAVFPPNPDGLKPFMPHEYVYAWLTTLVFAAAAALTARGLDSARRFADVVHRRAIQAVVGVIAILLTAASAAVFLNSPEAVIDGMLTVVGLIIVLISILAWVFLFAAALGGWLARERPRSGWGLAALGTGLYLSFRLLVSTSEFIGPVGLTIPTVTLQLAWLTLLLAFLVGLPSARADPRAVTPPGSGAG